MNQEQAQAFRQEAGRRLARRRADLGYTQEVLALALTCSPQAVSSWESGRSEPGPEFRPRLAEVLQLRGLFSTWWESGDCSGPSPSEAIAREIEREAEGLSESYRARLLDIARRVRGLG